ncbi:MAG TPA: OmpA family protein [Nitrospira sp.]|nr:OmpA family protein [Nitrospira sp.]
MRMERRTILSGGLLALTVLALVCIPRHLPSSASTPVPVPANFHARLESGTLLLRGSLPEAGARDRIVERARAAYDPAHVRVLDQLSVDGRIAAPPWVSQLPAVLPVLGQMQGVRSVMIDGRFLVLSGVVESEEVKSAILRTVSPLRSLGLQLEDHMTVAAAAAGPSLQARLNDLLSRTQIEFDSNQASLTARGRAALDRLVPVLTQAPHATIEIGGHTDAFGAADYNKDLSQRRAEAVKDYLTSHGVTHELTAVGYGATKPLVAGISRAALQRNRRIELHVLETIRR